MITDSRASKNSWKHVTPNALLSISSLIWDPIRPRQEHKTAFRIRTTFYWLKSSVINMPSRIVSSEHVMMDYIIRKVPSEIELLKKMRKDEDERVRKAFAEIVPGVTKNRDVGVTVFRRRGTGVSQRGRTAGHENVVIQGGDIVAAPSQGTYAYVLREGETEPPPDIKKLWAEYRKIDKILVETIKVGLTPREIVNNYKAKFEEEGIIIRDDQLHLFDPKERFLRLHRRFRPWKNPPQYRLPWHGERCAQEEVRELFRPQDRL